MIILYNMYKKFGKHVVTSFLRGGGITEFRRVEDMEEGGVKKLGKSGDVLYGRPLSLFSKIRCCLTYLLVLLPIYLEI